LAKKLFAGTDKVLFERAAKLRKRLAFAEELLWNYLRIEI
jgi:hypothetical protein